MTPERDLRSSTSFLRDRANLLTLAGLLCGVLSIYLSALQAINYASICLLWALLCDWFDGPIARRMTHRDEVDRAFGGQLDSLVDLVCGGVAPGFLLLSVSGFNPWFLPGAFALAVAGAIRLAHFNVSPEGDAYSGLPIDTNIVVITLLVGGRGLVGELVFPWLLYGGVLMLAMLNVASFRMPKPTRPWYYAVVAYVISMTALQI